MVSEQSSNIALLAGPQLLGVFFDWALQGVLSMQIYLYHLLFPRDSRAIKCLVYGVGVYEWIRTILITRSTFETDVYEFGNRSALTAFHDSWFSVTIMCAILSAVVQGYFGWRIWVFSSFNLLPGMIMFFAFCQMCTGIAGGVILHTSRSTATRYSPVEPILSVWLISAALVDVVIAVCMAYYLRRGKSGLRASDALVDRLVTFSIETCTLTATVAILNVVAFIAFPNTLVNQCLALVLAKLYANTLVASLNNRAIVRRFGASNIAESLNVGMAFAEPMNVGDRSGIVFSQHDFLDVRCAADPRQPSPSPRTTCVREEVEHEEYDLSDTHTLRTGVDGCIGGGVMGVGVVEMLEPTSVESSLHFGEEDKPRV
ncbi:hypothetical protein BC628DRAFT_1415348 [Trametes gibbosa]|nr:hypothetical protein BC628DRAFT_1415348 [Trametes gibbosa]